MIVSSCLLVVVSSTATSATYRPDPSASYAEFSVDEVFAGRNQVIVGRNAEVAGSIDYDRDRDEWLTFGTFRVRADSFITDNAGRNRAIAGRVLRTDREGYEWITFRPRRASQLPAEPRDQVSFLLVGDLTIMDVTAEVEFEMQLELLPNAARAELIVTDGEVTISRRAFDVCVPGLPVVAQVHDELRLSVHLVMVVSRP